MNLDRMFQAGVALAIAGVVWSVWPQGGEAAYRSVTRRWHSTHRHGPAVLIDRGHWNRSSADPRLEGLIQLLAFDGYQVSRNRQEFVPELLHGTWVLVVADALGWKGALRTVGLRLHPQAFSPEEVTTVRDWVRRGGSLLLIADRAPAGEASQSLADAFGVRLADGATAVNRVEPVGGLGEDVNAAMSFGGGEVSGPPGCTAFLKTQGIAFESGRGRVVVLTAQLAAPDGRRTDNRQLILNIMHWLSRAQ